jgi:hypothetical protein
MPRALVIVCALAACAGLGGGAWLYVHRDPDPDATAASALLDKYCVDCHNPIDLAGSLRLDNKDFGHVGPDAAQWEHVVRKLSTGMMPPAGERRPPRKTIDTMVTELEARLDRAEREHPTVPERTALRRLNRTEYANAIRDLLHVDVDSATLLPLDDSSEGFDNIATSLGVSPSLVEAYVSAAMKISRRALGDPTTPRSQVTYAAPQKLAQDRHLEGLPLGTRGGLRIEHDFPLDATYEIRIGRGFRLPAGTTLDVTLDGAPVETDNPARFRLEVPAGPHTLTAALVDAWRPAGVDDIYAEYTTPGGVQSIEIDGPLDPSGVGDTPSRRRILICTPHGETDERPCAERILSKLATRAFRRPVSHDELTALMEFYDAGSEGGFEAGIERALSRVLVDPRFLYRFEPDPATVEPGAVYEVGDFELASRLSFFLWSSIPDDELLATAAAGRLHEPDTLVAEVRRMLADPKADALVDNFAAQWLLLRELDTVTPAADAFDENLRQAMLRETTLFLRTVMREDMSVLRLLDADFTFVNERLAEHYGIPGVHGSEFRRIRIPADNPRRGLLGQGSILTLTSVTSRTSPVIRGRWVLQTLLGTPAPTPPPNVNTTLAGDKGEAVAATVREQLEAHRKNPTCAACHAIMDPIGFSLENYDLIGTWRDTDGGQPIDTHAALTDGTVVDGPATLRDALLDRSDAFVTTMTGKLMTYALGRRLEYYDMPTVRAIVRQARDEDYRFSAFVLGVVQSRPFRSKVKGAKD